MDGEDEEQYGWLGGAATRSDAESFAGGPLRWKWVMERRLASEEDMIAVDAPLSQLRRVPASEDFSVAAAASARPDHPDDAVTEGAETPPAPLLPPDFERPQESPRGVLVRAPAMVPPCREEAADPLSFYPCLRMGG